MDAKHPVFESIRLVDDDNSTTIMPSGTEIKGLKDGRRLLATRAAWRLEHPCGSTLTCLMKEDGTPESKFETPGSSIRITGGKSPSIAIASRDNVTTVCPEGIISVKGKQKSCFDPSGFAVKDGPEHSGLTARDIRYLALLGREGLLVLSFPKPPESRIRSTFRRMFARLFRRRDETPATQPHTVPFTRA